MSRGTTTRLSVAALLTLGALVWVWRTNAPPQRVSLFITAAIGAVTIVYALFTYEILIQNQRMAKAASDSSALMERSLRFSHAANLIYETVNTKDPTFKSTDGSIVPIDNPDYKRAVNESSEGGAQTEFVFAVIKNEGQGPATNVSITAAYSITDSSNVNRDSSVTKRATVQIVKSKMESRY